MPPSLPEAIGKYTIERFIESGGMGDVFLARDPVLDRPVAIKFLREGFDNQEMRERFEREARAAGRLSHPNIVTIYEFGVFESRPFIAMEFVRGEPLSKLIRRREPISLIRKLEMMEGLCSGLAHAHKTGLVHRDIKPANLMVDLEGGTLKILDFGIVRMAGSGLTSHGVLVGTINYMSPEQITGRGTIDHRSDVFAVGAVLHEIFTYQRAFPGEMTDVLYKIVHAQPESAATLTPGLDPAIVRAIDQCLDKAADRRYQDLAVLRRELARIRQRLEIEEQDTYGHTAVTLRHPKDGVGRPPSGAHRLPRSGAATPPALPAGTPVSGTPPPSPPSPPSAPSAPSARSGPSAQTPASERARRAAEAAAELERARRAAEEAQRELEREAQEQARLDAARLEAERIEAERQEAERVERERQARERADAERLERERQARERAQAEQARLAREQAAREQARRDQERAEQARRDHERQEQARQEQLRLEQQRAEAAERARVEHERREQARLEAERVAREQAERERAEAQRKAEAERVRLADERRRARARDLVQAQKDVTAGRFAEAMQRLQPWTSEAADDGGFATVLQQAQAGLAQVEDERRTQEALARQIESAKESIVRQDFAGAASVVQAILAAHPKHPAAKSLEQEIARGLEFRAKAASAVERARSIFDATPGEALELLERFTPRHGLVDTALAELRERHAIRERERQRREQQARRQAQLAALKAKGGELARNRAVQAGVGAALVLVVVITSWSALFAPTPADPGVSTATPPPTATTDAGAGAATATPPTGTPAGGGATQAGAAPSSGGDPGRRASPVDPPPTASVDAGPAPSPAGRAASPPATTPSTAATGPSPGPTGTAPRIGGVAAPPPGPRPTTTNGQAAAAAREAATTAAPVTTPASPDPPSIARTDARAEPAPEPPRDIVKETAPPPVPTAKDAAEREIRAWIEEYRGAFDRLDGSKVRAMNPASIFQPRQFKSASVAFSNVDIQPRDDGQSAVLHANVQYQFGFRRGDPQTTSQRIAWSMRKTPAGWVVEK